MDQAITAQAPQSMGDSLAWGRSIVDLKVDGDGASVMGPTGVELKNEGIEIAGVVLKTTGAWIAG